ncbi:unnamed protein product, partial [Vitis vinifera]
MAKNRKRRKRRVPEILWRLFRHRARTLADTIVSLIPPLPHCGCNGRRCLGCIGGDADSYLLRPQDPCDYRKLLSECFVVVSYNAPPLSTIYLDRRWSQLQIVRKTIEMIMCEQPGSSNVLCGGYSKCNNLSSIVELLTSSAWGLLLERVGDDIMVYLLKHTSIFLPLPHKMHCQVAGPPISDLCIGLSKHISDSKHQKPSLTDLGPQKKMERNDGAVNSTSEEQQLTSSFNRGGPVMQHRKRLRPSNYQQARKCSQLKFQGNDILGPYTTIPSKKESLHGRLQQGSSADLSPHHEKVFPFHEPMKHFLFHLMFLEKNLYSSLIFSDILNSLKPNFSGANVLLRDILGLSDGNVTESKQCFHNTASCLIGSACLYHSLVSLLTLLIRKTQSCRHLRLLDKHCAIPSLGRNANENALFMSEVSKSHVHESKHLKKTLNVLSHQFELNRSYCSKSQVISFISAVCKRIVPSRLLGTPSNWRILRKKISKFVWLRRFEKLSLKQCMHKLKISRFPLLSNKHSSCHLKRWIFWFFSSLVVPLVQANFYVTESEHGKNDLFYYQKSVWEKLTNSATTCLKEQSYRSLDDVSVGQILSDRSFGFSRLRFRPKENGVRALANLNGSSKFRSVNFVLRDLHAVLKGLQMKEPERLGSSIFDYNDVYRKLCPFLISVKNGSTTMPSVFIVVSDVSKAFDSVNQDKLLKVMKDVIVKGKYLLKQSCQVVCTRKALWAYENQILVDQNIGTGLTEFTSSVLSHSLHSVLVNQVRRRTIGSKELYFNLNEHVKRNVLQLGNKFYLQNSGIPQGSVLSSLLCSFYYGHMDRNDVSDAPSSSENNVITSSPKYMLLRFIDDFLFLSTSKQQAASFFSRLQRGFRDYNCYMNEGKFGMNFDIGHISRLSSNRIYVGEDGISFLRWSGLLINCCSLEVQADYTRYANSHLSSTLTVCWQGRPGRQLKARLFNYMQLRCHPLFYDSNINSAATVRLNIYQAFLLSAMKFHCYTRNLSNICKLQSGYHMEIIEKALRRMHTFIKRRMRSMDLDSSFHPILQLKKGEVLWLGLKAFIQVLKRKQSRHKELLSLLKSKLLAHPLPETASPELKYAVDDSHSSLLWKIKY